MTTRKFRWNPPPPAPPPDPTPPPASLGLRAAQNISRGTAVTLSFSRGLVWPCGNVDVAFGVLLRDVLANEELREGDVVRAPVDNRAIGLFGGAEVWVKPWIPANYVLDAMSNIIPRFGRDPQATFKLAGVRGDETLMRLREAFDAQEIIDVVMPSNGRWTYPCRVMEIVVQASIDRDLRADVTLMQAGDPSEQPTEGALRPGCSAWEMRDNRQATPDRFFNGLPFD